MDKKNFVKKYYKGSNMVKSKLDELVDRYIDLWSLNYPGKLWPKLLLDDTIYPLKVPIVSVSRVIGILGKCSYEQGLRTRDICLAKDKDKDSKAKGPVPDSINRSREISVLSHKELAEVLDSKDSGYLSQKASVSSLVEDLRENLKDSVRKRKAFTNLPIFGKYKGLTISGQPDYLLLNKLGLESLEEWKFTSKGKVRPLQEIQIKLYAYLASNWLGTKDFSFTLKVWTGNLLDQFHNLGRDLPEYYPPTGEKAYTFTPEIEEEVEAYLSKILGFYTASIPCTPQPGLECSWCPYRKTCIHREDWSIT